jgi:hypothetical protein
VPLCSSLLRAARIMATAARGSAAPIATEPAMVQPETAAERDEVPPAGAMTEATAEA